jgi:hypothetical protein
LWGIARIGSTSATLTAAGVDGAASSGTTPADVQSNLVAKLAGISGHVGVGFDAAIVTAHSAITTLFCEMIALCLAVLSCAGRANTFTWCASAIANLALLFAGDPAAWFVTFHIVSPLVG